MNSRMILSGPMSALRPRFGDEEGIRRMARAGFDAVDYTFNEMVDPVCVWNTECFQDYAAHLRGVAKECGIFFNQAHAPFLFDWNSMWQASGFDRVILPTMERAFQCAALLGIPQMVVHPIHHIRYHGNEKMLWQWNMDYYRTVLLIAKKYGVKIALENMWQTDPLRGCGDADVFSHPKEFRDFLDKLNDPWAAACVDVGHAGLAGEDPVDLLYTLGSRVKALHIHDNHHKSDDHTLPYLGKLDWSAITRALGEIGYDGDFTFEVTSYLTAFDDEMVDSALRFQVEVGRYLIEQIRRSRIG